MTIELQVRRGYEWFLNLMDKKDWNQRKRNIQSYLLQITRLHPSHIGLQDFKSLSISDDRFGWYMYLAETWLFQRESYEPIQGARVVPIFAQIGADLKLMARIGGVREKCLKIINPERRNPDAGLFEILTALMYARNGWQTVEFIPRSLKAKRPDIRVKTGKAEWFVECKRLVGSSEYSTQERRKWLRMWQPFAKSLWEQRLPLVIEICFHVELDTLSDDFVLKGLSDKLKLVVPPCAIIENREWTVQVRPVDMDKIRECLSRSPVKQLSNQLHELIIGRRVRRGGTTCVYYGQGGTLGLPTGTNRVVSSVAFAAGAIWDCDAPRSIEIKARDIRSQLANAVEQLPAGSPSVVHIGLETLDGWLVEQERYARICRTVGNFDARSKQLNWIYCHLFQPYAPPEQDWEFDETVYFFKADKWDCVPPLKQHFMVVPDEHTHPGVHWV